MEYKTIVDTQGKIIDLCVMFINNEPQHYEILEGQQAVEMYKNNFIKPRWTGSAWIETATEEEIKELEESNKPKPKESTEIEILKKQLLETQAIVANLQEQILLNVGIK